MPHVTCSHTETQTRFTDLSRCYSAVSQSLVIIVFRIPDKSGTCAVMHHFREQVPADAASLKVHHLRDGLPCTTCLPTAAEKTPFSSIRCRRLTPARSTLGSQSRTENQMEANAWEQTRAVFFLAIQSKSFAGTFRREKHQGNISIREGLRAERASDVQQREKEVMQTKQQGVARVLWPDMCSTHATPEPN